VFLPSLAFLPSFLAFSLCSLLTIIYAFVGIVRPKYSANSTGTVIYDLEAHARDIEDRRPTEALFNGALRCLEKKIGAVHNPNPELLPAGDEVDDNGNRGCLTHGTGTQFNGFQLQCRLGLRLWRDRLSRRPARRSMGGVKWE
jgi:hypothetical protein